MAQSDSFLPTDKIVAEDWNRITGQSQRNISGVNTQSDPTGHYSRTYLPDVESICVINNSGAERAVFDVLELTELTEDPTSNVEDFKSQLTFTGGEVTASGQPFCVLAERLPAGVRGRAIFHGMTRVRISISDEAHQYADISAGVYANLISVETGAAKILWKESGTGTKWAVVLLGAGGGGGSSEVRRAKLTASAGSGNTITANLYDSAGVEQTEGDDAGVTVYCDISDGTTNLDECIPRLVSGKEIKVVKLAYDNEGTPELRWYCTAIFQPIDAPFTITSNKLALDIDTDMFEIVSDKLSDKLDSCE